MSLDRLDPEGKVKTDGGAGFGIEGIDDAVFWHQFGHDLLLQQPRPVLVLASGDGLRGRRGQTVLMTQHRYQAAGGKIEITDDPRHLSVKMTQALLGSGQQRLEANLLGWRTRGFEIAEQFNEPVFSRCAQLAQKRRVERLETDDEDIPGHGDARREIYASNYT